MNNIILSAEKEQEIKELPILPITNSRIDNLTHKIFNHLTVIGRAPSPNNDTRAYWWCICDCENQNIIRVSGKNLKNGNTKSCGCLQKSIAKQNAIIRNKSISPGRGNKKDLTNKYFGKLIALEATDARGNDGSIVWKCKCTNDNNIIFVPSHLLLNNTVQSCGCISSNGENKIEQLLKENNISYKKQFSFNDLYDKNPSYPLKFDFAIFNNHQLSYLIEYDGIQHFIETNYFHENLKDCIKRDQLKDNYCKNHNITLIRIPYTKYKTLTIKDLIIGDKNI